MTLRKKTLVVVATTFILVIALLYLVSETILLNNLVKLEEDYTRQNTEQALNALSGEISSLEAKARDWAAWDDTYAFIEDANSSYIQSNLVDSTFTNLKLNLMVFIHSSGRVVFGKAFDLGNEREIPVPLSLEENISGDSPLVSPKDADSLVSGILLLGENPMIITSQPILTSEEQGPARGRLIMGRYIDDEEVRQLARQTLLSLTVYRFTDREVPSDFELAKSSITEVAPVFVRPLDEQSIAGYAVVEDIYGNPGLVLRVDVPRDIYQQTKSNTLYSAWLLVLIGLALAAVIALFLEKQVLSRLSRLSQSLSRISASKNPSARVSMSGTDELASLANTINETLSALQQSQSTLHEREARYRALFEHSMDAIFITTRDGRFVDINKSALDLLGYSKEEILRLNASDMYADTAARQRFQQQVEKDGSIKVYEHKALKKDGTVIDCLITSSVQKADDGSILGYQTTTHDITRRKRAEEMLLNYKMAVETSADLISVANYRYVFLLVNQTFLKYFGLKEDQVIGHTYAEVLGEKLFKELKPLVDRCLQGELVEYEAERNFPEFGRRYIDVSYSPLRSSDGRVVGAVATVRDMTERRQAEELFRTLANSSPIGIYIVQQGKFQYANAPFAEIVGYSPGQLVGMNSLDLVFPEDRERVRSTAISMLKGESSHSYEYRVLNSTGEIKWIMETVASIQYRGKRAALGNFLDITGRKKAEEQIRLNEARLQSLLDISQYKSKGLQDFLDFALNEAIKLTGSKIGWFGFYQKGDETLNVNTWSREVMEQCRIPEKTLLFPLKNAGIWAEGIRRRAPFIVNDYQSPGTIKKGYPSKHLELHNFLTVPLLSGDEIVAVVAVANKGQDYDENDVRQLTLLMNSVLALLERRKMEHELQESESFSSSLLDNAPNPITVLNPDMSIRYANPAMEKLTGFSFSELVGKMPPYPYWPEEGVEQLRKGLEESMLEKKRLELIFKKKDGKLFWVEMDITPVMDNGKLKYVLANWADITERKQSGERLKAAYEQEKELRQKLEAEINKRVEFTRALVHELKTPLTPVMASSELLATEMQEEPWLSLAKNIHRSASNLNDRIDELLDIARGEIGMLKLNPGPVSPLPLLKDIAQNVEAMLSGRGQSLSLDLPSSLASIQGDEERLRQVLLNLLNNASKFTPRGGKITIRARERYTSLVVEIEDTGPGIDKEDQWQLFTPYRRLENERQRLRGLGLGLALCKTLVELHGGKIWVESDKGKGSIFAFSLPM